MKKIIIIILLLILTVIVAPQTQYWGVDVVFTLLLVSLSFMAVQKESIVLVQRLSLFGYVLSSVIALVTAFSLDAPTLVLLAWMISTLVGYTIGSIANSFPRRRLVTV